MENRMKKLVVLGLVAGTLLFAGCGEEEKYNTAKNELLELSKQSSMIEDQGIDAGMGSRFTPVSKYKTEAEIYETLKKMDELESKQAEIQKKADEKIAEMEKLAKSKVELNNDFVNAKEQKRQDIDGITATFKTSRDTLNKCLEEMASGKRNKDGSIPRVDPWAKYNTWN